MQRSSVRAPRTIALSAAASLVRRISLGSVVALTVALLPEAALAQFRVLLPESANGVGTSPGLLVLVVRRRYRRRLAYLWLDRHRDANGGSGGRVHNLAYNLVGNSSYPGIYVAKGYVTNAPRNNELPLLPIRVAYDSNTTPVNLTTGAPFRGPGPSG